MSGQVPSPADVLALPTARELIDHILEAGGRVHRSGVQVYVLTQNPELATELIGMGGQLWRPSGWTVDMEATRPHGAYRRGGKDTAPEWDIVIQMIPVRGEETFRQIAGEIHGLAS